ncbi:uncharacterized protein LOC122722601 [Manihot esculenta]|uniref:uncharacterized protein LOC122722601 n=1 Tax=Manihot esculenta TaxID=3983 RepID=UPI001CC34BE5|nr:uncharacterized protein LOC122722601 [Manihot esculenta]
MVGQPYGVPRGDWWQQLRGRQLAGQRAVGRFVVGQRSVVGQRAWLASGRGWPAGVVGLRVRLAYGYGWPTELVGQRKFQGSLVGLRKFQKAPERASSAQNWPETARTAQNWPELPRSFQNLVGQQIQPSKWVPQATQPPCPEFSTGCEITKKSLKVLERQS